MHFLVLYTLYKDKKARYGKSKPFSVGPNWEKLWNVEMIYDIYNGYLYVLAM